MKHLSKEEKRAYTAFKQDSGWKCSQEVLLTGIEGSGWDTEQSWIEHRVEDSWSDDF